MTCWQALMEFLGRNWRIRGSQVLPAGCFNFSNNFDDYLTPLYEESTSAEACFASVNIWVTFLYPLPLSPMTLGTTTFSAQLYSQVPKQFRWMWKMMKFKDLCEWQRWTKFNLSQLSFSFFLPEKIRFGRENWWNMPQSSDLPQLRTWRIQHTHCFCSSRWSKVSQGPKFFGA